LAGIRENRERMSERELRERILREDHPILLCSLSLPRLMFLTAVSLVFKSFVAIARCRLIIDK